MLVPIQALRELAPGSFAVFVVQPGGELAMRPVQVGLRDFVNAEIVSGLKAGEQVNIATARTQPAAVALRKPDAAKGE